MRDDGSPGSTKFEAAQMKITALVENITREVIIGKDERVKLVIAALFAGGHVLLIDVPGVAKTRLARAIAKSIDGAFERSQSTPDQRPSDIVGYVWFNQKTQEFDFIKGPVFTNLLLSDEINRAMPQAQAALLEAMEERQVTVFGETRMLPKPFFLIATQNPIDQEGTNPLPEAQLDRFMIRATIGYPSREAMEIIVDSLRFEDPLEALESVIEISDITDIQGVAAEVEISEPLKKWILDICERTRQLAGVGEQLRYGVSPRGDINLMRMTRAFALVQGRAYATDDDVLSLLIPVLGHRLIPNDDLRRRIESTGEQALTSFFAEHVLKNLPYNS